MLFSPTLLSTRIRFVLLFIMLFFILGDTFAEGTRELAPSSTDIVSLNLSNSEYYYFARYDGTDEQRLYIHIADPENEQVFLGFSEPYGDDGHYTGDKMEAYFRILDPSGNVVYGPTLLDASSANIASYAQAVAGPSNIVGGTGYTPFTFDPSGYAAGDYYIEFSVEEEDFSDDKFYIELFDITVASTDGTPVAKPGRMFAKNWAFHLPSIDQPSATYGWFDRPFNGKLYVYADEGFVSDIDFDGSGFQPAAFNISVNNDGTVSTNGVLENRKSLNGAQGNVVQYKIFLNDPDNTVYPDGVFGNLLIDSTKLIGCVETGLFFKIATTKTGVIELLLDQNQTNEIGKYNPGTADRILAIEVDQQLTDATPNLYVRYIPWDGKDGLGTVVDVANPVPLELAFSQGRFHIPIYDAEYNLNGFTSSIIRPSPPLSYTLNYYFDDTNIPDASGVSGQTDLETEGCTPRCHKWSNSNYGNENTINTWWFAKQDFQSTSMIVVADCGDDLDGDNVFEANDIDWDNDGIPNMLESCTQPTPTTVTVQVDIQLDFYASQTKWDIKDGSSATVASGGPYAGMSNVFVSDTLELEPGNYTFNIYDSNSNGITGYYQLTIDDKTTIGGSGNGSYGAGTSEALSLTIDYFACFGSDPSEDTDFDGIPDYKDLDFGTLNSFGIITFLDPDSDGIPSFLDLDSDNDGIPDIIEAGGQDTNNDGEADYPTVGDPSTMDDSDNDGLADAYDPDDGGAITNAETDDDDIHDAYDLDSDNDGLADLVEVGGVDANGNGIVDEMSDPSTGDTNNNGWGDLVEASVLVDQNLTNGAIDFDGDNQPNHLDLDSDDDGITDVTESLGSDGNSDGLADNNSSEGTITDTNIDGWDDNYDEGLISTSADGADANNISDFLTGTGSPDFDNDGLPNWLDIDADDDGIVDNSEGQKTASYIAPTSDTDNDGLNDAYEVAGTIGRFAGAGITPENTDGIADWPDYIDQDSDEDQEPDNIEGHDANGDGVVNGTDSPLANANSGIYGGVDNDLDGLDDGYDNDIGPKNPTNTNLTPSSHVDFDNAVTPERDWRETDDIDLDNDGITNVDEDGGTGFSPISDEDSDGIPNFQDADEVAVGFPNFEDANNDGINDWFDTDIDGVPDYIDLDSDNDGIPDIVEAGGVDTNSDGRADDLTDTDGDGLVDDYDASCSDVSCSAATTGVDIPNTDKDGDGVKNYLDLDADNDGIPDLVEAGGIDANGDGRIDDTTEKDGDGLRDIFDGNANDGSGAGGSDGTALVETNGSGIWQDGATGSSFDTDGDNLVDGLDLDTDNDGIPDLIEAGGADGDGNGFINTAASPWDADGDGLTDIYDTNASDGANGNGTNGTALVKTTADSNADGRVNSSSEFMTSDGNNVVNADTDELPNHKDIDADNDGIVDLVEGGGTDANGDGLVDDFNPASPSIFDTGDNDGWSPSYDGDAANDGLATIMGDGTPMIDTKDNDGNGFPESYNKGDSDEDAHPDFLDIDADDDGIVDNVEAQTTTGFTLPNNDDTDNDGLDEAYDNFVGFGGTGIDTDFGDAQGTPNDHDADKTPDYLDWDTDGDNVPDEQEAWDDIADGDSRVDASIGNCEGTDSDRDGLEDCFDSDTNSPMVTSYKTPIDDNGMEGSGSSASSSTSGNNPSEIFPNNDAGDGEPDWRDVNRDCTSGKVYYAISEKSPTTMTDYEFNGTIHVDGANTSVVRATAFCEPDGDGWYYFYNTLEPENYLFALRNSPGSPNTVSMHELVDYVELKVEHDIENRYVIESTKSNLVMARDWLVEFKGTPTTGSTFDIKFYFLPAEMAALKSAADEVQNNVLSGDASRSFFWFKKEEGLSNDDIVADSINNMQDITSKDPNDLSDTNSTLADGDGLATGNGRNYVSFENLNGFSGGTAGIRITYSTLPVELTRFAAKVEVCDVVLDWMTASEENFSHYEIERSSNGRIFEQISRIQSQGGATAAAYQFTDTKANRTNYYRLKMVDLDGSFSYSEVEIITIDCANSSIEVFPNPVKGQNFVTLAFNDIKERVSVSVFDVNGKRIKVMNYEADNDQTLLDISDLIPGSYLIHFHYGMRSEAKKFVKM